MLLEHKEYVLPKPENERERELFNIIDSMARDIKQLSDIYLDKNGERGLTADWNAGAARKISAAQLAATIAIGTTPLLITSTTKVDNLNADLLDGLHAAQIDADKVDGLDLAISKTARYIKIGDLVVKWAWGSIVGNDTAGIEAMITFDSTIAFTESPVILPCILAAKATTAPTAISELVSGYAGNQVIAATCYNVGTTTAMLQLMTEVGKTFNSGYYYGFSYMAIGKWQ